MDLIDRYLQSQRVLNKEGKQETTLFGAPLYKTIKAAKIAKRLKGIAGYIGPDGEPAYLMGNAVIRFSKPDSES